MSAKPEIINFLGEKEQQAIHLAQEIKLNQTINSDFQPTNTDYLLLDDVIEVYELAIIELWKSAFDKSRNNLAKKNEFHQLCKNCFILLEVLPIPEKPLDKIKHVLKLITYSYLGEKWEDMKRILLENKTIWKLSYNENDWDMNLFATIYVAILHLTRKEKWEDLTETSKLIVKLRQEQEKYEKSYLDDRPERFKRGAAYELASLYHLAKVVEFMGEYMLQGTPGKIGVLLDLHFDKSIRYCQKSGQMELELILRMLQSTFKKMIENSIWAVARRVNSRVKTFTDLITKSSKPVFELMYPQRITILEKGLLDPANKAIVVTLPTSSGKTMIAEFRILQALNQFTNQNTWIAYVAPTKALVNQITNRLRKDLGQSPLNIRVEKMSSALEPDEFEKSLLEAEDSFDILVVTPEKLNLLIRQGTNGFNDSLVLTIVDEAHNLDDESRGLNFEMLLSLIKNDCENANLLLLTPFLPNSNEIAEWLDPENPKSIGIELNWQPNDSTIGLIYSTGERRDIATHFKPLLYTKTDDSTDNSLRTHDPITVSHIPESIYTAGQIRNTKYILTSVVSEKLIERGNVLVLAGKVNDTWKTAKTISNLLPKIENLDERISLVKRFISAELGDKFPLSEYLERGIGVHNAGLPDEIKQLMEWLMENNLLKVLVSTNTIAQGMNFPVSSILLSNYSYRHGPMPTRDFWNLAGRAGRIDQQKMGLVGIAVKGNDTEDAIRAMKFVQNNIENVVSVLVKLIDNTIAQGIELNLRSLANEPEWSNFLQYLAHMYNQSDNLQNFISQTEIILRNTYGYHQLEPQKKTLLLEAVNSYGEQLDENKEYSELSDLTGFSPETVEVTMNKINSLSIEQPEWEGSRLFSNSSETLTKLMGVMLDDIPEIKKQLSEINLTGNQITNDALSGIVADWVSGKGISEIAHQYFGGTDVEPVRDCVTTIYGKLSTYATWGLSAIQKMSTGTNIDALSDEEKSKFTNLPAMVYYGVNTNEAILMRMNNVPRSISDGIGKLYVKEHRDSKIYDAKSSDVIKWLQDLDNSKWNSTVSPSQKISGEEYKQIWNKLVGTE